MTGLSVPGPAAAADDGGINVADSGDATASKGGFAVSGVIVAGGNVTNEYHEHHHAAPALQPVVPPVHIGRPIVECQPIDLEVHRAIELPAQSVALPVLPLYVPRPHDVKLRQAVLAAADGYTRLVTLVGGSSTGKTRACWEAIQPLVEQPRPWQLWHPFDPSRPDAAAAALADIGPYTVVWLNEAQHYLLTPDSRLGERIAAGLRSLLMDAKRGPVLVLATMWPTYWTTATIPPNRPDEPDSHAQVRHLLTGTDITVPEAFTPAELQALLAVADRDPRLRRAAEHADRGRITQYLAGVPELLQRFRNAPAPALALIHAAIDARRFGHPVAISAALLEQAAPGYLTDHEWAQFDDAWLEQALAYTTIPCRGVPGPLTRIRPRPTDIPATQPAYRLADYVEQVGGTERAAILPPATFWNAAVNTITDPLVLQKFAQRAADQGEYVFSTQLYLRAAALGHTAALVFLAALHHRTGDAAAAEAMCRLAADRGHTFALRMLAEWREQVGDTAGAQVIALEAAGRGDTTVLRDLAELRFGEKGTVPALAEQQRWDFAYHTLAQRASEAFVDVMRLISVRATMAALQANLPRYGYFVHLGNEHLRDLRIQIEDPALALNPEIRQRYKRIELRLSRCLERLSRTPTGPDSHADLRASLRETAGQLIGLLSKDGDGHWAELAAAKSSVAQAKSASSNNPPGRDDLDEIRLYAQTVLLGELQGQYRPISSIGQDVDRNFSFSYFMVDYILLIASPGEFA